MNVWLFIAKVFGFAALVQADMAQLESGQPVSSPKEQVGTHGGKPLYVVATFTLGS